MDRKCVFAGTFDPPTVGHKAMIEDCLSMFGDVVVAVMVNPGKTPLFSEGERAEMLRRMFAGEKRVKVVCFSGTAAELLQRENARIYVRGVRNVSDYERETSDFFLTSKLDAKILVAYLPCRQELLHVSSTAVRNCLKFSVPVDGYVTEEVKSYMEEILNKRKEKGTH